MGSSHGYIYVGMQPCTEALHLPRKTKGWALLYSQPGEKLNGVTSKHQTQLMAVLIAIRN